FIDLRMRLDRAEFDLGHRVLATPGSPPLVDECADQHLAGVAVELAAPLQSRPHGVHPGERGLHEVLRESGVAAQEVRRPVQRRTPAGRERRELAVPCRHLSNPQTLYTEG